MICTLVPGKAGLIAAASIPCTALLVAHLKPTGPVGECFHHSLQPMSPLVSLRLREIHLMC